ncbi:Retrovirus-related Pol polyprotein from transposon TNT 1-94 [Trichinella sp. T8]|nr:Retrovirus-related Pol polyprotein from transposon TNT 1-94 [Trichinella sp. T8]
MEKSSKKAEKGIYGIYGKIRALIMTFCNGPVAWSSMWQKTIALSTVDAEYMALTEGVKDVKSIRQLLMDLGRNQQRQGVVSVEYTPSDKQPADMLTKSLSGPGHLKCRQMLGMNVDPVGSEVVLK